MSSTARVESEILKKIRAASGEREKEIPKEIPKIETEEIVIQEGYKAFSDVFGFKPKSIPDMPVRVYALEDWDEAVRERIPEPNPQFHWNHAYAEQLAFGAAVDGPLLAHGPTGTGKTSMLREFAALTNQPFFRVGCHKQMEAAEFLGANSVVNDNGVPITQHTHTDTTLAATYGGLLCVDEAFRSPILMAIQSLLEVPHTLVLQDAHGNNRTLKPARRLMMCLTDNTNGTGDVSGMYDAEVQDLSTLDRIRTSIYVDYNPSATDRRIVKKWEKSLPDPVIKDMVEVANRIRNGFKKGEIMQTFSIRALLNWAENTRLIGNPNAAFRIAFYNKLSGDDQVVVNSAYRQVFGDDVK